MSTQDNYIKFGECLQCCVAGACGGVFNKCMLTPEAAATHGSSALLLFTAPFARCGSAAANGITGRDE